MSEAWKPWFDQVKAADVALPMAAIVSSGGAICYADCQVSGEDVVKSATSYASLNIGGTKFMRLGDNEECVNLRGSGRPAIIYKTSGSYILCVGEEGAEAGNFAAKLCAHFKSFTFYDPDTETYRF